MNEVAKLQISNIQADCVKNINEYQIKNILENSNRKENSAFNIEQKNKRKAFLFSVTGMLLLGDNFSLLSWGNESKPQ